MEGRYCKKALLFVGDELYHSFPFKDNLELMNSFEGEFFYLGGLLEKGLTLDQLQRKWRMLANECALCEEELESIDNSLPSFKQGKNFMATGVLHFWCSMGFI